MNLLFDQNLSPRLLFRLADLYPHARHVSQVGLDRASDEEIWAYAKQNGFAIVTKDADFNDISVVEGIPPKVIWIRVGDATTTEVEALLRCHDATLHEFVSSEELRVLELF